MIPTTEKLYFNDSYATAFEARILAREPCPVATAAGGVGGEAVVLDRTLFYPSAGGQPHDTGELGGRRVHAVKIEGGIIRHLIEGALDLPPGARVRGEIDAERRADYRAQHHAQHLISAAAFRLFQLPTRAVRLSSQSSTIDLQGPLEAGAVARIEEEVERVAGEAREVRVHYLEEDEAAAFGLRRPAKVRGIVRVIEVVDFDRAACGGTHPRTSAEVAPVRIAQIERVRAGATRLHFLAGWRAFEDYRAKDALVRAVAAGFSTSWREVAKAVDGLRARERQAANRAVALADELGALWAREWLGAAPRIRGNPVILRALPPLEPTAVQRLARRLAERGASCALLAEDGGRMHVQAAVAPGAPFSAREWVAILVEPLAGRGGGSREIARGSGPRLAGLERALEALRSELGLAPPRE